MHNVINEKEDTRVQIKGPLCPTLSYNAIADFPYSLLNAYNTLSMSKIFLFKLMFLPVAIRMHISIQLTFIV